MRRESLSRGTLQWNIAAGCFSVNPFPKYLVFRTKTPNPFRVEAHLGTALRAYAVRAGHPPRQARCFYIGKGRT